MNRIDPTGMTSMMPKIPTRLIGIIMGADRSAFDIVEAVKLQSEAAARLEEFKQIQSLLEDAAAAALAMAGFTKDMAEKAEGEAKAKLLQEVQDWADIYVVLDSWASAGSLEQLADFMKVENLVGGAEELMKPKGVNKNGKPLFDILLDRDTFFGGAYNRIEKISILIHAAAHQVFANRYSNNKSKKYIMYGREYGYNEANEMFAYEKSFGYLYNPNNVNKLGSMYNQNEIDAWNGNNPSLKGDMLWHHALHSLLYGGP